MKLTLIEKIETYKQMAEEMKEITADVNEVKYRIEDVSIEDMQKLSEHFGKDLDTTIAKNKVCLFLNYSTCSIYIYSIPCEIKTTVEYTPIQSLQQVA